MRVVYDFLSWVQSLLQRAGDGVILRIRQEPIGTAAVLRLGLYVGTAFGLGWSGEQVTIMAAFLEAVTLWAARRDVTPSINMPEIVGDDA